MKVDAAEVLARLLAVKNALMRLDALAREKRGDVKKFALSLLFLRKLRLLLGRQLLLLLWFAH